jgi:hypothetical protein
MDPWKTLQYRKDENGDGKARVCESHVKFHCGKPFAKGQSRGRRGRQNREDVNLRRTVPYGAESMVLILKEFYERSFCHPDGVTSVMFSEDGSLVVSGLQCRRCGCGMRGQERVSRRWNVIPNVVTSVIFRDVSRARFTTTTPILILILYCYPTCT